MKNNIIKNSLLNVADANESGSGAFEAFRGGAVPPSATKICANQWCNKPFIPLNGHQKYCCKECASFIHERQKHGCAIKKTHYVCEQCGNEHNGSYGIGRFCSKECKIAYIGKLNDKEHRTEETAQKVKKHLDSNRVKGLCGKPKAPYGTWKCEECQLIFETRAELFQHQRELHAKIIISVNNSSNKYECPFCNKEFDSKKKVSGHLHACKKHPNKELHNIAHKRGGQTFLKHLKEGSVQPSFKGRKHSEESKRKMRISASKYLQTIRATPCRYNKFSISVLEKIAKEHGWNIQHAENGGEFYTGIGYFVDAQNNVLHDKDIKRQKEIIDHLHCEYWRYNSVTNVLWKIN